MEKIKLVNGNKESYFMGLPKIHILGEINDVALEHIKENTGLEFKNAGFGYVAQPKKSKQIIALIMTYNYKTQYHNNATNENILFLKFDHHVGFNVDCICYDCVKKNNIKTAGIKKGDFLSC